MGVGIIVFDEVLERGLVLAFVMVPCFRIRNFCHLFKELGLGFEDQVVELILKGLEEDVYLLEEAMISDRLRLC